MKRWDESVVGEFLLEDSEGENIGFSVAHRFAKRTQIRIQMTTNKKTARATISMTNMDRRDGQREKLWRVVHPPESR